MPARKHISLKIIFFLIFIDLLETFAQFCFKKSAVSVHPAQVSGIMDAVTFLKTIIPSPFLWIGLISVSFIFISWSTILSKIDLSVAVPVCSFSYVTIPLVSVFFLHEHISALRWLGICLILVGVILVSLTSTHKERPA